MLGLNLSVPFLFLFSRFGFLLVCSSGARRSLVWNSYLFCFRLDRFSGPSLRLGRGNPIRLPSVFFGSPFLFTSLRFLRVLRLVIGEYRQ